MADVIETMVWEPGDAPDRLAQMDLDREKLEKVGFAALAASADTTANDTANAAGQFAYLYGTRFLRDECVGENWRVDRADGVESICNDSKKIKVIFQNVDIACSKTAKPKPRSKKGAGSERACQGNLFPDEPDYAPRPQSEWATFYLMVDEEGNIELTRPVVKSGTFVAYVEQIPIAVSSDWVGPEDITDEPADDFEIEVTRKQG